MSDDLHYKISIPEWQAWPFIPDLTPELTLKTDGQLLYYKDETILRPELVKSYKGMGLKLREVQIFVIPPAPYYMTIHVDGSYDLGDRAAINWIRCDSPWTMNWYKEKSLPSWDGPARTGTNSYVGFDLKDCDLIESYAWSDGPCLVKTTVPHNVTINGNSHRICASIRFQGNDFSNYLSLFKRN